MLISKKEQRYDKKDLAAKEKKKDTPPRIYEKEQHHQRPSRIVPEKA